MKPSDRSSTVSKLTISPQAVFMLSTNAGSKQSPRLSQIIYMDNASQHEQWSTTVQNYHRKLHKIEATVQDVGQWWCEATVGSPKLAKDWMCLILWWTERRWWTISAWWLVTDKHCFNASCHALHVTIKIKLNNNFELSICVAYWAKIWNPIILDFRWMNCPFSQKIKEPRRSFDIILSNLAMLCFFHLIYTAYSASDTALSQTTTFTSESCCCSLTECRWSLTKSWTYGL